MPGYAAPIGTTDTNAGTAKSVSAQISSANSLITIFTATEKTRVNSVLVSNELGTILPVELFVYRDEGEGMDYLISKTRVLKSHYMVLPLVSGDTRVTPTTVEESINDRMILTEVVLAAGDSIKARCPVEDVINVTLELKEGIR